MALTSIHCYRIETILDPLLGTPVYCSLKLGGRCPPNAQVGGAAAPLPPPLWSPPERDRVFERQSSQLSLISSESHSFSAISLSLSSYSLIFYSATQYKLSYISLIFATISLKIAPTLTQKPKIRLRALERSVQLQVITYIRGRNCSTSPIVSCNCDQVVSVHPQ